MPQPTSPTNQEVRALASQYVTDQLGVMERHGCKPKLSRRRRAQLILDVIRVFKKLRDR